MSQRYALRITCSIDWDELYFSNRIVLKGIYTLLRNDISIVKAKKE